MYLLKIDKNVVHQTFCSLFVHSAEPKKTKIMTHLVWMHCKEFLKRILMFLTNKKSFLVYDFEDGFKL